MGDAKGLDKAAQISEEVRVIGHGESIGDPSRASWLGGGYVNVILNEVTVGTATKFQIKPWVSSTQNIGTDWPEVAKKLTAIFPDQDTARRAGEELLSQRDRWFLIADEK